MLHFEDLQEWNQTIEDEDITSCDAFEALQERLNCIQQDDELPTTFIVAAIAAAENSAWPPQLLQQTLQALYKAVPGADISWISWSFMMCCSPGVQGNRWLLRGAPVSDFSRCLYRLREPFKECCRLTCSRDGRE